MPSPTGIKQPGHWEKTTGSLLKSSTFSISSKPRRHTPCQRLQTRALQQLCRHRCTQNWPCLSYCQLHPIPRTLACTDPPAAFRRRQADRAASVLMTYGTGLTRYARPMFCVHHETLCFRTSLLCSRLRVVPYSFPLV